MSVLGRLLVSSSQRLDLPDLLSIDSYNAADFKYLLKGMVSGDTPLIVKGFELIEPQLSIGGSSISIKVSDSVLIYPTSKAGPFFHGLEDGNALAQPLIPELKKNNTNYVYLTLTTQDTSNDTRSFFDPDKEGGTGGEFTQDVNTESALIVQVGVSVSSFPANTIPITKVVMGPNFIQSIEDCRNMMLRLGTGGVNPDPYADFQFNNLPAEEYSRNEPSGAIDSQLDPNPFQGGDKNLSNLKEWMDAVMTKLKELGGTTYWYGETSGYSLPDVFADSLASSVKSKGKWSHSSASPGQIGWTEDIIYQSMLDSRDLIIRSATKTLADNQVMYVKFGRKLPFNSLGITANWFNGATYVNGDLGAFADLRKGDWIKKVDDTNTMYVRVERFLDSPNGGGSSITSSLALSVEISAPYAGTTSIKAGRYCRGVYSDSLGDIKIVDRDDPALMNAGGSLFWLANRADTVQNISSITPTTLNVDIVEAHGTNAKVICHDGTGSIGSRVLVAHGLIDKERINITDSVNFNGENTIEVVDANTFYIEHTGAADETAYARFATLVTAATRSNTNPSEGIQLESAAHNFETNQLIVVDGTGSGIYNGLKSIFVRSSTSFTFPITGPVASVSSVGTATLAKINVRTEIGQARIIQGESKFIGEVDTDSIQSFIGMESLNQVKPIYAVNETYNTINGQTNYNGLDTDSLTDRVSKLTAMMADKTQDKTIKFAPFYDWIMNITNGVNQDITSSNNGIGVAEQSIFTFPAKSALATGQCLLINSANNANKYYVWSDFAGDGITNDPTIAGRIGIPVNLSLATTNLQVAIAFKNAIDANVDFTATDNLDGTITVSNTSIGTADDPLNHNMGPGFSISVITQGKDAGTPDSLDIVIPSSYNNGSIPLTGTLSLGENQAAYFSVDRNKVFNIAGLNALTVSNIVDVPLEENIYIFAYRLETTDVWLWDQTELSTGRNYNIRLISQSIDAPCYDEEILLVSGSPVSDKQLQGPILAGTTISLPKNSRNGDSLQAYEVRKGILEVYINGIMSMENGDWSELGIPGTLSSSIMINIPLDVDDVLHFRISAFGGYLSAQVDGETINAANVGTGAGVFKNKTYSNLNMRSIIGGGIVSVTQNADDITVTADLGNYICYNERLSVIAGSPINTNEVQGPILAGNTVTLPNDSRNANLPKTYEVGKGQVQLCLNGITQIEGLDWEEVGILGTNSSIIQINIDADVDDVLHFRINGYTVNSINSGVGEANTASNLGTGQGLAAGKVGVDLKFKSLKAGTNITLTPSATEILIDAASTSLVVTGSAILKGDGVGGITNAIPGIDYALASATNYNITIPTKNTSGSTKTKATPIRIDATGSVAPINVATESEAISIVGVVATDMLNGASGNFINAGKLMDIVSLGFSLGDVLYVSKTGTLTNVKPAIGVGGFVALDFCIRVGIVIISNSNPLEQDLIVNTSIIGQL